MKSPSFTPRDLRFILRALEAMARENNRAIRGTISDRLPMEAGRLSEAWRIYSDIADDLKARGG